MILEIEEVSKSFGGLAAVRNVSFTVSREEIVGLIGPNGAGKTTLLNIISGVYQADKGSVLLDGKNIGRSKAHEIATLGIARTFQITSLFSELTSLENVLIARHGRTRSGIFGAILRSKKVAEEERRSLEKAVELLKLVNLAGSKNVVAKNLPYGHQRCLAVAVAMALEPRVLLLDEPIAGMNETEAKDMISLINRIRNMGVSVLLVEHNMKAVMSICEKIVVINYGERIAEGDPKEIAENTDVIEAYLGKGYAESS